MGFGSIVSREGLATLQTCVNIKNEFNECIALVGGQYQRHMEPIAPRLEKAGSMFK